LSAPREGPAEIVAVEGVSFAYGSLRALEQVTLSIGSGATGLLGPNGAGKTTLIHLLLGLMAPTSGHIRLFGREQATGSAGHEGRQQIGYMPENDALVPGMSGVEMVAYLARLSGLPAREAIARAHEALYYVGLGEARYRPASEFSTGMRQRLKLAQALVHGPRLVILDEPTNGLDPLGRDEMLALIRDLWQNKGLSVLLSSHLLPDVEATCRSVIVLDRGRVVTERQLEAPAAPAAADALLEVRVKDRPQTLAERLRAGGATVRAGRAGALLVELPPGGSTRDVFEAARSEGLQIRRLMPVRASLEDIFVEAVQDAAARDVAAREAGG
jgi:ABC-2 type transport system ATP-binding protein